MKGISRAAESASSIMGSAAGLTRIKGGSGADSGPSPHGPGIWSNAQARPPCRNGSLLTGFLIEGCPRIRQPPWVHECARIFNDASH